MDVTVSVRHFALNNEIKQYAMDAVNAAFADFRLKISAADLVLDMQKNQISATLSVGIKDNPVSATSAAYDNVYKAIDEVVDKTSTQARRYLDKKQDHSKATSLKDAEAKKASEN